MATATLLDSIEVATPCPARWGRMEGDDRVRFCLLCSKHVYNLSAMTAEQAEKLILEKDGGLCVRLRRRRDGTVITADCPVGVARLRKRLNFLLSIAAGLIVLSGTIALWAMQIESRAYPKSSRPFAQQWASLRENPTWQIKEWLGLNPPPAKAPVTCWQTGQVQ